MTTEAKVRECTHDPRGAKVRQGGELVCYWCAIPQVLEARANPIGRCSIKGCLIMANAGEYYCRRHRHWTR